MPTLSQTWEQLGDRIDGEGGAFGLWVSLSSDGKTAAVGAPYSNDAAGKVRVFSYNEVNDEWNQLGQDIDGEAAGDDLGTSVSLSGDGKTVAVGAPFHDSDSGLVRVYKYDETVLEWSRLGQDIDGEAEGAVLGASVSLSSDGRTVAIGAPCYDWNWNSNCTGSVHVYEYDETIIQWNQLGQDIDGVAVEDQSGTSVSMSSDGKTVAIGAPYNDGNGFDSGHVRVYEYDETMLEWTQLGADIDGEAANDSSGHAVSLSSDGKTVAIGAWSNDGNGGLDSGHVRIWTYNEVNNEWIQLGQEIDGEAAWDYSGYTVSLSSDGKTVAIGADGNDGNGDYSGHVRVYIYNESNSEWQQTGYDIDGDFAGDRSGWSVSLSSDGETVAIGSPYYSGAYGFESGHVRIFSLQQFLPSTVTIIFDTETVQGISGVYFPSNDLIGERIVWYRQGDIGSASKMIYFCSISDKWVLTSAGWRQELIEENGGGCGGYENTISGSGSSNGWWTYDWESDVTIFF